MKVQKDNSNYILHHYMLTKRNDTEFWRYYNQFDVSKTVWKFFDKHPNKHTNLYSSAMWAQLGLYFDIPKP